MKLLNLGEFPLDFVKLDRCLIANLEAPITDGGREIPVWEGYTYRAPARSAAALAWAGFDLLTMANNHIGQPIDRIAGRAKVTGRALYAGAAQATRMAHGVLITATIGRGRIARIELDEFLLQERARRFELLWPGREARRTRERCACVLQCVLDRGQRLAELLHLGMHEVALERGDDDHVDEPERGRDDDCQREAEPRTDASERVHPAFPRRPARCARGGDSGGARLIGRGSGSRRRAR